MMYIKQSLRLSAAIVGALLIAACGSDGDSDSGTVGGSTSVTSSSAQISSVASSVSVASSISSSSPSVASSSSDSSVSFSSTSSVPSSMSSSSSSIGEASLLSVIYPGQYAHLGGVNSTKLVVAADTPEAMGSVTNVKVADQLLVANGDHWVLDRLALDNTNGTNTYPVLVEVNNEWLVSTDLVFNNQGQGLATQAGANPIYAAKGIAFDNDDEILYFSNPFDAEVYQYNNATGVSDVIYQGDRSTQISEELYWPISVDSQTNTVYLLADSYSFGDVGSNTYSIDLVSIREGEVKKFPETGGFLKSTKGMVLDLSGDALLSRSGTSPQPSLYTLDFHGQDTFQRWVEDSGDFFLEVPPSYSAVNSNSTLPSSLSLTAFTGIIDGDKSRFLFAREYETSAVRGTPSLVEITSTTLSNGRVRSTAAQLTMLQGMIKPTALLYSKEGTQVYIADNDRIWLMDMNDFTQQLITSSNGPDVVKGSGPRIGSKVTAMVLHPTLNYLYLAAGNNGVIMVDLETGNRATLAK